MIIGCIAPGAIIKGGVGQAKSESVITYPLCVHFLEINEKKVFKDNNSLGSISLKGLNNG